MNIYKLITNCMNEIVKNEFELSHDFEDGTSVEFTKLTKNHMISVQVTRFDNCYTVSYSEWDIKLQVHQYKEEYGFSHNDMALQQKLQETFVDLLNKF